MKIHHILLAGSMLLPNAHLFAQGDSSKLAMALSLPVDWTPLQPEAKRPTTIHIAQTAKGNDSGRDADNARSVEWFNNASNWNSSRNLDDGIIGPGDVVEFHGVITSRLTVRGSGTVGEGNSIQIVFADDGLMSVPTSPNNTGITDPWMRTQIFLDRFAYLTLMNVTFDPHIGQGDLPDDYYFHSHNGGTEHGHMISKTLPHFLIYIGYKSTYWGTPVNIRIQNCHHNNAHIENNLTAVMINSGNNILLEGNSFENMQGAFTPSTATPHSVTIRNNRFIGNDDSQISETERYARPQDIIRVGALNKVLIEGNYLALRKWKAEGEMKDQGAYHSDIIQLWGAGVSKPGDIIIRNNYFENNCSPNINRSWIMVGNLTKNFYIYGNIFMGRSGGSNGIQMSGEDPNLKVYIYNNTFVAKEMTNIIGCVRAADATNAQTEEYHFNNNLVYSVSEDQGIIYGQNRIPLNYYRSNNIYFSEIPSKVWPYRYAGLTRTQWLAGETGSRFINPLFTDFGNDKFFVEFSTIK